MRVPEFLLSVLLLAEPSRAAFYYPNAQVSLLDHILVDNWGAYASNFSSAITPCTNYVTEVGEPALISGRTTAAQWIRVIFHDFVTANVTAGTGGVDASIGFETLRSENSGSAMNDSFTFWRPFMNDAVSMADLVAIGTVVAMGHCGGHQLPFQPGRIDATAADPTTGVPAPQDDLVTTLQYFERAGFNMTDSIGLTACGHTMGSVHHGGFPDVVPASAVTANNTNGGIDFDTTRGVFDPRVVHEYIDGTGHMGGPLVTTDNVTTRSDLRLYESDGNTTMRALYAQGDGFLDTCVYLMGRMLNTVPSSVRLGDPIQPMTVKPINVTYDFGGDGKLSFSGRIRVLTQAGGTAPSYLTLKSAATYQRLTAENETGSSVFGAANTTSASAYGTTTYFPFEIAGIELAGATSFVVSGPELETESFPIQGDIFVVPSMTEISSTVVNATIAVRPTTNFGACNIQVAAPIPQMGTLGPKIIEAALNVTKVPGLKDGYELWQGSVDLQTAATGLVSIKVMSRGAAVDVLMINPGVAGW